MAPGFEHLADVLDRLEKVDPALREAVEHHLPPRSASAARAERNDLIRETAAEFYYGLSRRATAKVMSRGLVRQAAVKARADRGDVNAALARILKANDGEPIRWRQLDRILSGKS